jgi:hypothetical protein
MHFPTYHHPPEPSNALRLGRQFLYIVSCLLSSVGVMGLKIEKVLANKLVPLISFNFLCFGIMAMSTLFCEYFNCSPEVAYFRFGLTICLVVCGSIYWVLPEDRVNQILAENLEKTDTLRVETNAISKKIQQTISESSERIANIQAKLTT